MKKSQETSNHGECDHEKDHEDVIEWVREIVHSGSFVLLGKRTDTDEALLSAHGCLSADIISLMGGVMENMLEIPKQNTIKLVKAISIAAALGNKAKMQVGTQEDMEEQVREGMLKKALRGVKRPKKK